MPTTRPFISTRAPPELPGCGRVRLDAVDGVAGVAVGDRAVQGGDVTKGHAGAELQAARVANGHHFVAHLQVGGIRKFRGGQAGGVNLDNSQVGLGVLAYQSGLVRDAVGGDNFQLAGAVNHMLVGDDVAILGDDDAGAFPSQGASGTVIAAATAKVEALAGDLVVLDAHHRGDDLLGGFLAGTGCQWSPHCWRYHRCRLPAGTR